ncbi:MAG: DUF2225 domain-containing protein [Spirochaetes bacterium]|nr:DUF2225 domain-containing protein [Spirochaetota bacterium]
MAEQRLTFFQKRPTECPVCGAKHYREELLSGGGRLIAAALTDELRRAFEPSKKYGDVHPLIYAVAVCPVCLFAAWPGDFPHLPGDSLHQAEVHADERRESLALILPELDFMSPRGLREGMASYFLAVACYPFFDRRANPTFKAGLAALRAAWLLNDLHQREPGEAWDELAMSFYRSARDHYLLTLEREQKGQEALEESLQLGPDLDKNYGYDGVIYLAGYLDWKYGDPSDPASRVKSLEFAKRMIAKVFGMGRASKAKPSVILDKAHDVYAAIGAEVDRLKAGGAG